MKYKTQNYMINFMLKELIDKLQKDYIDPSLIDPTLHITYSFVSYAGEDQIKYAEGIFETVSAINDDFDLVFQMRDI